MDVDPTVSRHEIAVVSASQFHVLKVKALVGTINQE